MEDTTMYAPAGVRTNANMAVPERMRAWVLGDPGELAFTEKPVPVPARAEVLVRIDAVAICATDLDVIAHGPPALIQGGMPFNKNWTPGHEYMGTVAALGPGVDEYRIGQRVTVEIHAGCGQRQRLHHRRRLLRIPGQQHQHTGGDSRRDVGRGGNARRHRRHRDVRPHRT